jgi:hypothetical protein
LQLVARIKATEIQTFGWKPEGKKPLRSYIIRWVPNIKMIFEETESDGAVWIPPA